MAGIVWEKVNIKQNPRRATEAFASVGLNYISLSALACRLIENIYDYSCVEVHCGKENKKAVRIGLRFIKINMPGSIRVTRRKYKGEFVDGLDIRSKALIEEIYGKVRDNKTMRHPVEKVDESMLAIDITKEL